MNTLRISILLAWMALAVAPAAGQNAVQLPTYSSFRTNTTVSVPDRGSVYTGGINRASDGRNEFGTPLLPFRNRSIGSERSASSVWTSVYIHDLQAMDEALLSQARASGYSSQRTRSGSSPALAAGAGVLPWQSQRAITRGAEPGSQPVKDPLSKSIAELRAERAGEQEARLAEAERLFERGKNAQSAGKLNVARIYYQQASRRAQGPLQEQILAQLRLVTQPSVAER